MADDYSIIKRSDINTTLSDRSGFEQQTFLGASIRSFDCNAGFNNSSSTLNVSLVNDEYNKSDQTAIGFGADVYHNGSYDSFQPPVAGAPVFFAFGSKKPIDINDAWAATYYDTYKLNLNANFSDNKFFTFGGILQGYTQNEGANGKPLYDVSIVDPREILSNSTLILSNYAGTTYNNKNLFNIFGFLEYEPSDSLRNSRTNIDPLVRSSATTLRGSDTCKINGNLFPLTGIGFSRRCEQGIPWYRISQALEAMFGTNGPVPDEYVQAGFGGAINFRGYNYIVDFGGLPLSKIPNMFFINQDQIDILSLVETLCTAISHEYFIRLLPVLNCDKTEKFYDYNQQQINSGNIKNIIAGIIRVDAIDKSVQPNYGALKSYLEKIQIYSDKKIGFELSNVPTDKFIVGAQTVDMYCFDGSKDRANNEARLKQNGASNNLELQDIDQWSLSASLKQQILPFFGFIGNKALTIPRGYGVFKQVMLDVSSLNCLNVGKYYVATEAEIQAAGISFEAWKSFLKAYDNVYLELTGDSSGLKVNGWPNSNDKFGISVPRCVFNQEGIDTTRNSNPCSPHFGFPLYYKRYSRLFIDEIIGKLISTRSESGNVDFQTWRQQKVHSISDELLKLNWLLSRKNLSDQQRDAYSRRVEELQTQHTNLMNNNIPLEQIPENPDNNLNQKIERLNKAKGIYNLVSNSARSIHDFLSGIAKNNLGKKFLVKIPQKCNINFSQKRTRKGGPFGFPPIKLGNQIVPASASDGVYYHYLDDDNRSSYTNGSLKVHYNPITLSWEYNYKPESTGGFLTEELYASGVDIFLAPTDPSFLIHENKLSSYAIFNYSNRYSFSEISEDSRSTEIFENSTFVDPSIIELFRGSDGKIDAKTFQDYSPLSATPTITYVKCDIDSEFYMPPKTIRRATKVYGSLDQCVQVPQQLKIIPKLSGIDPSDSISNEDYARVYNPITESYDIDTKNENLDSTNVYALITLPGSVNYKIDPKEFYKMAANNDFRVISQFSARDTVNPLVFRDNIPIATTPPTKKQNELYSYFRNGMWMSKEQYLASMPEKSTLITNSYVYPDLTILSLLSKERCYGPWRSASPISGDSRKRYADIGGKVEFEKDESLAPWNYGSYEDMNQAGIMKAQFSNSLFLVAEKGGFTFPDAPTGLSLLSAVGGNGPLVTSISVNVSEGGISTTVSMDTYSTKFGELNKQQQEKFAIINKQVQKLKDMQNLSIRNSVTKKNLSDFSKRVGSNIKELYKPSIQKQTTEYQVLVAQAVPKVDENGNRTVENACSLQSQDYYNTNNNYFDKNHFNADQQNCGGQYFSEFYTPYSTAPYHPNMPYAIYLNKQAIDERMDS